MRTSQTFRDRTTAGDRLAEELREHRLDDPVILALPRGGVPVAARVARSLEAPLDVVVVRKVGAPHNPEYALGAIGEGEVEVLDDEAMRQLGVTRQQLEPTIDREREELRRRLARYRGEAGGVEVRGRTAVVVDDGIATGSTAAAAAKVLRARGARRIVLAVPVGPPRSLHALEDVYDQVIALEAPQSFMAVGTWYEDFGQTTDEEVVRLLADAPTTSPGQERAAESTIPGGSGGSSAQSGGPGGIVNEREVTIELDEVTLPGILHLPPEAKGLIVFAHGSGSSRHSPRNQQVAAGLHDAGMATLLFDLLTEREGQDRRNVFDIPLLGRRLADVVAWTRTQPEPLASLPVGTFGASTGGAAALDAAAVAPDSVRAVVSRGGRPDLAQRLGEVRAPVLLIVGEQDTQVIDMNREAAQQLQVAHELELVPGAGHLFEGPGQLEQVTRLAAGWFAGHLQPEGRGG